jgi:hypothetical protein
MNRILAIVILLAGCQRNAPEPKTDLKTLSGVVIEKRANVKSYEAWNAPSDPYYALDIGKVDEQYSKHMRAGFQKNKHEVTLRPSRVVTTEDISKLKNRRVAITAKYTDGERYEPSQAGEAWPYEIETTIAPDGSKKERPIPAKRGRGYIVYSIKEQEE